MGICGSKTPDEKITTPGGLPQLVKKGSFKCVDGSEEGRFRSVVVAGLPNVLFEFTGNEEERNWWAKIDQFLEQQQCLKRQILRSIDGSIVIFIFAVKASRAELQMLTDKISGLFPELDSVIMRPMHQDELDDSKRLFPRLYKEILEHEFQSIEEDRKCIASYLDQEFTSSRVFSHFYDHENIQSDSPLNSNDVYKFLKSIVVQIFYKLDLFARDELVFASEEIDDIISGMKKDLPKNSKQKFTSKELRTYCKWLSKNFEDILDDFEKSYCRIRSPSGWYLFDATATPGASTKDAHIAVGILEGYLMCSEINSLFQNFNGSQLAGAVRSVGSLEKITDFVSKQLAWVREQVRRNYDPFWDSVGFVLNQFDGIVDGYLACEDPSKRPPKDGPFSAFWQVYFLTLHGDLEDLENALSTPRKLSRPWEELECSALIKIVGDDIFFGQTTWRSYYLMQPRVYKNIQLPKHDGKMQTTSFSSSPGYLPSEDDWFIITDEEGHAMSLMETTNGIYDKSLYEKYITYKSVPYWIRIQVANKLGTNGKKWADTYSQNAAGTYNNQWMILDLTKRHENEGLLTILEEIPGTIVVEDLTSKLKKDTFWPSFNIPYFPEIWSKAGYRRPWDDNVRFHLFSTLQTDIKTLADFRRVMQWNDPQSPLSGGSPRNAIAKRSDLANYRSKFGGIDGKVASLKKVLENLGAIPVQARVGPTHDDVPPFCWDRAPAGQTQCFEYDWIDIQFNFHSALSLRAKRAFDI